MGIEFVNKLAKKVGVFNSSDEHINPATEEKMPDNLEEGESTDTKTGIIVMGKDSDDKARMIESYKPVDGELPSTNPIGLVTYTEPRAILGAEVEGIMITEFFRSSTGSKDLNVNVGFTGTPEKVHNGTDIAQWTASALSGNWDFASTTHAKQGIITVIQYGNLSGKIITVQGTNITNTVLTEGVDWTAGTNNDTTASSIQSAVDGVDGVSATVSGSVVTVIADNTITQADMTTLSTDATVTDMTATAQSIDASATVSGDEALLEDGTSIDFSNFTALTLNVYLLSWNVNKNNEIKLRFRNNGANVGNEVLLSTFIRFDLLNVWQSTVISKTEFGIDTDVVDELVIETVSDPGLPPQYYIDIIQIEESGIPQIFTYEPPAGYQYEIRQVEITFSGASADTALDPDKFWTLTKLSNGIVNRTTKDGIRVVGNVFRENSNFLSVAGGTIRDLQATGSKLWGKVQLNFGDYSDTGGGFILRSSKGDKIELIISDDLSGLDKFDSPILSKMRKELI